MFFEDSASKAPLKQILLTQGATLARSSGEPIQVGKGYTQTPIFNDEVQYLEFDSTWTIPPGILRRSVIPRLEKDPAYLEEFINLQDTNVLGLFDRSKRTFSSGCVRVRIPMDVVRRLLTGQQGGDA